MLIISMDRLSAPITALEISLFRDLKQNFNHPCSLFNLSLSWHDLSVESKRDKKSSLQFILNYKNLCPLVCTPMVIWLIPSSVHKRLKSVFAGSYLNWKVYGIDEWNCSIALFLWVSEKNLSKEILLIIVPSNSSKNLMWS